MALHIARKEFPDTTQPLKAAQVSFIGPVVDSTCFQASLLRRGKSATQIGVDAHVKEALAMRASFVFCAERATNIRHMHVQCPAVLGPEAYSQFSNEIAAPGHFRNFDVRFVSEATPVSGAPYPELIAWVRFKESEGVHPESALIALGDCLPPASMACFTEPAPISSMTWSFDLPQPAKRSSWFLQRTRSLVADNGYSFQLMDVWNSEGELVLVGTQTVAIFA